MITERWKKSSYSNPSGNCLEARWRKSSFSGGNNSNGCVESRVENEIIQVRDSKEGEDGTILSFTRDEWTAFLTGVRAHEFDLP